GLPTKQRWLAPGEQEQPLSGLPSPSSSKPFPQISAVGPEPVAQVPFPVDELGLPPAPVSRCDASLGEPQAALHIPVTSPIALPTRREGLGMRYLRESKVQLRDQRRRDDA